MSYGSSGDVVYYTYGELDRLILEKWNTTGPYYRYYYNANGALAKKAQVASASLDATVLYALNYEYDSLGRLIFSSRVVDDIILRTEHEYDATNRLSKQSWQMGNTAYSESYQYDADNGLLTAVNGTGFEQYAYTYDALQRRLTRYNKYFTQTYSYPLSNGRTSNRISRITYSKNTDAPQFSDFSLSYTYDSQGNIASISAATFPSQAAAFKYDVQGQVTEATIGGQTFLYSYDTFGNIRAVKNDSGSILHSYTYGNTVWKDLLTAYDGYKIAYEGQEYSTSGNSVTGTAISGNPVSYYNSTRWNMGWEQGRQLKTLTGTASGTSYQITNSYDPDGIRNSKVVKAGSTTTTYNYVTMGGKVVRQTWGSNVMDFIYDADGQPYALVYNGTLYYYVLNLQGDVIRIISSTNGTKVAEYKYDLWGKPTVISGTTIANANPLRYRGYYYDAESGFYYLQSRFYDPKIGRFINADQFASTGQGFLGYNMFAYCNNNSVNYCDPSGHSLTPFTKYIDDGGGSRFSGQFTSALPSAAAAGIGKAISEFAFSGDLKKSLQAGVDVALQVITITLHPDLIDVYVMYTFGSNAFDAWSTGASGYRGLLYGLSSVISTMMSTPMWSDELTDFLFQIESSTITELFSTVGMYCLSQDSSDTNSNYSYDLPLPIISGSNTMTGKATATYSCFF